MSDYEIGYGKPPKGRPYKKGQSGNPGGRRKRIPEQLSEIVEEVLDAPMEYHEDGKTKIATRREVAIRLLVQEAKKGNIRAAEELLKKRSHAIRHGQKSARRLIVEHWLPDHPGQTAEQKAQAVTMPAADPAQSPGKSEPSDKDQNAGPSQNDES